jgi:predicted nuclease of predicted toxin-antitoxin system
MNFLANENIPLASVDYIRRSGFYISSITQNCPGISDEQVLSKAKSESSIIITFDRDYGELIFKKGLPSPGGILYLRFLPAYPEEPGKVLLTLFKSRHIKLENNFTIVERNKIRQRPLPE